jgi:hypothetical protein
MSERLTSFSEILAPLERTKESLSMSQKKISGGVVHQVPADLKKALTSDPQANSWRRIFSGAGSPGTQPYHSSQRLALTT